MPGARKATGSWQRIVWIVLAVVGVGAAVGGAYAWKQAREERRLYTNLEPYFTSEANRTWEALPRSSRIETGLRALAAVEELAETPWGISITDLRANGADDAHEAVFRLEAGDTELLDCTVSSPEGDPAGACARFRHVVPSGEPRLQNVPLALHLEDRPYAETLTPEALVLGADGDIQVKGTVRVDEEDVAVRDPVLLLPSPHDPEQLDPISVAEFSPRTEAVLRSVESYKLDISYPMPASLSPFFAASERLRVFYAEAATSVDLTAAVPVYRFEGMLEVMNRPRGRVVLEYQPESYIAAAVTDVSIPIALSDICLNVDKALLEVDLVRKSFRVIGATRNGSVESFACRHKGVGEPMGFTSRLILGGGLSAARSMFDLPSEWISEGQLVVDLDDGILCGDLAVQGSSVVHAAYFGNKSTFRMWAPLDMQEQETDLADLAWGAVTAGWSFPSTNPRKCWDDDAGLKIDLERTILNRWPQEREDAPSPFPFLPAAAVP